MARRHDARIGHQQNTVCTQLARQVAHTFDGVGAEHQARAWLVVKMCHALCGQFQRWRDSIKNLCARERLTGGDSLRFLESESDNVFVGSVASRENPSRTPRFMPATISRCVVRTS